MNKVHTITATELLTLLERLLQSHAYITSPEGVRMRCECQLCQEIWAMLDGED